MSEKYSILVFISGRGSNLKNLLDRGQGFRVKAVITDNPEAPGLVYAQEAGIPSYCIQRRNYLSKAEFQAALRLKSLEIQAHAIALAGFMVILGREFISAMDVPIINIHPSLLPAFPGLETHERAIAAKETRHGCTVHLVDAGVDTGQVLAQAEVSVANNETPATLASKVLAQEHRLYPWVLENLASGDISVRSDGVLFSTRARSAAIAEGFLLPGAGQ